MKIFQSKKTKFILAISILLVSALWIKYSSQKVLYQIYSKTVFTEKEQETIIGILGNEFSDAQIEGLKIHHIRDIVNIIYVSNIDEELVRKSYSYCGEDTVDTLDGEEVLAKLYKNKKSAVRMYCYIYQTSTDIKAVIYIEEEYYDELYQIVKD